MGVVRIEQSLRRVGVVKGVGNGVKSGGRKISGRREKETDDVTEVAVLDENPADLTGMTMGNPNLAITHGRTIVHTGRETIAIETTATSMPPLQDRIETIMIVVVIAMARTETSIVVTVTNETTKTLSATTTANAAATPDRIVTIQTIANTAAGIIMTMTRKGAKDTSVAKATETIIANITVAVVVPDIVEPNPIAKDRDSTPESLALIPTAYMYTPVVSSITMLVT